MPNPHNSPVLRGGRGFEKGQLSAKENRMGKLAGKIALVTGGNNGIGFGKAVSQGGRTRFRDRAPPTRASGNNATEVQGDVSNLADLDRLFAQIREEKGGGRVLTNAQPHTY
jgi:NAD(P)-dependent dehydrogenase (short-subunit alcohol dehydrogenase family)